jgi:hypothetical protein
LALLIFVGLPFLRCSRTRLTEGGKLLALTSRKWWDLDVTMLQEQM